MHVISTVEHDIMILKDGCCIIGIEFLGNTDYTTPAVPLSAKLYEGTHLLAPNISFSEGHLTMKIIFFDAIMIKHCNEFILEN
jgi:hypothetical protein